MERTHLHGQHCSGTCEIERHAVSTQLGCACQYGYTSTQEATLPLLVVEVDAQPRCLASAKALSGVVQVAVRSNEPYRLQCYGFLSAVASIGGLGEHPCCSHHLTTSFLLSARM